VYSVIDARESQVLHGLQLPFRGLTAVVQGGFEFYSFSKDACPTAQIPFRVRHQGTQHFEYLKQLAPP
jgi:hypothetical protein